jgi:hypothetical protein
MTLAMGAAPGTLLPTLEHPFRLIRWGRAVAVFFPLLLYAGSLANGFLIDDEIIVASNIRLAPGQTVLAIFQRPEQFADFTLPYFRPLTNLSYWLDAWLWNSQAVGYHVTNWLLHAAATSLTFELLLRLTGDPALALLSASLFAAHPIHTESVDMVQGRTDLLATLFMLLSLLAFRRYLVGSTPAGATAAATVSLLGFLGALLAKENAVMWPALAIGLAWADPPATQPRRRVGVMLLAVMAVLSAYLLARRAVLGAILEADLRGLATPRVGLVPMTLIGYVGLLLWPFSLSFIRQVPAPETWTDFRVLGAGLLAAAILGGLVLLARRDRLAALGAGWTVVTLLPVLNLVPIPGFAMAERYLYLPSVGFCLLVAALLRRGLSRGASAARVPLLAALAALLIAFAATIQIRTREWADPIRLYEAMAEKTPASFFVQSNLGLHYLRDGRAPEAVAVLQRARDLEPTNPVAWNNLGVALHRSGRLAEAWDAYQRAVGLNPEYARAFENLGQVLLAMGDRSGADAAFQRASVLRAR